MEVQYGEMMNAIIKGLLGENENKIIGQMLLQTDHSIDELISNDEEAFAKIYEYLTPTAFSVLMELKNQIGDELKVLDEQGNDIEFEE